MIVDSIRLRLLAAGSIAILIALALAGAGLGVLFQHHIENREASNLVRDAKVLVGALRFDPSGALAVDATPSDDRYSEAGSGLYWQLSGPRGRLRSVSLWDQSLPPAPDVNGADWSIRRAKGPFDNQLLLVERLVRPSPTAPPVLVQVAVNDESLREERHEFTYETAASLLILWLFLIGAAAAQVTLGLRPLTLVRRQLARLRSDPGARMTAGKTRELAPLVEAINALADAREADLERARRRAGDLAHGLKTPLAALAAQSRRARQAGASDAADGLDHAIASMRAALEAELARSRAGVARAGAVSRAADVEALVEDLIAVIERTERGERCVFEIDIPTDLTLPIATDDLTELLGALIENATRHARFHVRISGAADERGNSVRVEDDGPGIGDERLEAALVRGGRLDEAGPGHGFGLAIVQDLVRATGGTIALGRSALGGLDACITWPVQETAPDLRARRRRLIGR